MPLDPCNCPTTIDGLLRAIYCALVQIAENGAAVNVENITGISDFWKAALGETPAASQVLGTDGSGVFTTLDDDALVSFITSGSAGVTASQTPVTQVDVVNGIVVGIA